MAKLLALASRGRLAEVPQTCRSGASWLLPRSRRKFDVSQVPPWKRWSRNPVMRLPLAKFPEVTPAVDIFTCDDPEAVADAICEVVPWKRRWEHHEWLHATCTNVRRLLPAMEPRDVVRITLAFGELYTKRRTSKLLFYDYETYALLFQSLPIVAVTSKTLLPLVRTYRRMGVSHESFLRAACARVVIGEIELEPRQLTGLVTLLGDLKLKVPELMELAVEVLDFKFAFFSEDQVGDFARACTALRHRSDLFLSVLRRELPFRLHEYSWWNLIDIAEMYLVLQVDEREIIKRIGNETFKLILSMKYHYPAKALKILAFLETADKRTFRLLIRNQARCIRYLDPLLTADALMACVAVKVEPDVIYHRLRGKFLYHMLAQKLLPEVGSIPSKKVCDVVAALAQAGQPERDLFIHIEVLVNQRPYKFHAEHLVSLLRDFAKLEYRSGDLRATLLERREELRDCTPSALCALPSALAGHPRKKSPSSVTVGRLREEEETFLEIASQLLCQPGSYCLPADPRTFRSKDDLWWQQLRQRHFRLRRRAAVAGTAVQPAQASSAPDVANPEGPSVPSATAVAHIDRAECLLLIRGCAELDWRSEVLLDGAAAWLCEGRRHSELDAVDVADLLDAFSRLGFTKPLLRVALEHSLLRVAPNLRPGDCTRALQGALDLGMGLRSDAVRALLRRCTSELAAVPAEDQEQLGSLAGMILQSAEEEILQGASTCSDPRWRLPLEMQLFRDAVASRASRPGVSVWP